MIIRHAAEIILAASGLVFLLASLAGMIRLPDFYTRLHAQGVGDTLGVFLIAAAMMTAVGFKLLAAKIFLIFVIVLLTNPVGTNLMIIAAIHRENYLNYINDIPDELSVTEDMTDTEQI